MCYCYLQQICIGCSKRQKSIAIANTFQKFLDQSSLKTNEIWVGQGRDSSNRSMKHKNGIKCMYYN